MVQTYIKKPVKLEALQLTKNNILEVYRFIHGENNVNMNCRIDEEKWYDYKTSCIENGGLKLKTFESDGETQIASFGDFIIKGIRGEFYPCKPDIFLETYEIAPEK